MPSPHPEYTGRRRGAARWLLPAALLALAPKCLLCLLAYAGLGAALGLGGPELCGAPTEAPLAWTSALAWLGALAGGIATWGLLASSRCGRAAPTDKIEAPSPRPF